MRKLFLAVLLLAFIITGAHAATITNMEITVELNDGKAHEKIIMDYSEPVQRADYFVLADITNLKGRAGSPLREVKCATKEHELGSLIVCEGLSGNTPDTHVEFEFDALGLTKMKNNLRTFSYPFTVTSLTDKLEITVKLPLGAALADKESLEPIGMQQFKPESGVQGSDGRRILVKWSYDKPGLGETINVAVIYEQFLESQIIVFVIAILFVVGAVFAFYVMRRRSQIKLIMPVLTQDERTVMGILMKNPRKFVDQREIVRELDQSKSKISRVLKSLEDRGLITRIRSGRSNKVKAVDKVHDKLHKPETGEKEKPVLDKSKFYRE